MRRDRTNPRRPVARWPTVVLVAAFGGLGSASACAVDLSESVEGRPCTSEGRCLAGYVCSDDGICVRKTSSSSSGGQQNGADAGNAGGASGGTVSLGTGGNPN